MSKEYSCPRQGEAPECLNLGFLDVGSLTVCIERILLPPEAKPSAMRARVQSSSGDWSTAFHGVSSLTSVTPPARRFHLRRSRTAAARGAASAAAPRSSRHRAFETCTPHSSEIRHSTITISGHVTTSRASKHFEQSRDTTWAIKVAKIDLAGLD